ncbi:SDR family oxidoreductase [Salininema proteolyticum]|uniref:SDR family oxidoreductase n=1 Tax=Salininema proteolyticum TaxID=1607685 RepID=A0ABV8TTV2_9ACTN
MSAQRVLVVGATGYAGRHIVSELKRRGNRVRALVRARPRAEQPGAFGAPALKELVDEWVAADIGREREIPGLCEGVDRVVSALGVTRQKADPWTVDFRGNLRVLEAAEKSGVRSFLYVNVMHADRGTSLLMRSKTAFTEALRRSPVASQIVDPSGYFSDATDFLSMARRGIGMRLGKGRTRLNPIHGADLASFCADRMEEGSGEWTVGGPDVFTYQEISDLAFAVLDKRPRLVTIPGGAAGPVVWVADRLGPRASSLTRFFVEGLQTDAVGTPVGTRHLADHYRQIAERWAVGAR